MTHRTYTASSGIPMIVPDDARLAHLARPASHRTGNAATMYLSGCTNPPTAAAAHTQPRLGLLAQPGNSVHLQAHHYSRWAIDNGAFGKARAGAPWTERDTEEYLGYLTRVIVEVDISNVLFATAPDVLEFVDGRPIGDAEATWERSRLIFPRIRALGLPVALVAQDGITDLMRIRDWQFFDALFLGGSDDFKLGEEGAEITRQAKRFGKWVHMGRVNSLKRLQLAKSFGCDSADGTFIGFGPAVNLPKVLAWLEATASSEPAQLPAAA